MLDLEPRDRLARVLASATAPLSIRDLARLAITSPSTTFREVRRLAQLGLIRRRRVRGDRRVYVEATAGRGRRTTAAAPTRRVADPAAAYVADWPPRPQRRKAVSAKQRIAELAALDVPIWVIDPSDLAGYGIRSRTQIFAVIPERWVNRVDVAPLPFVVFKRSRPLELAQDALPPVELFVALLKIEAAAAKEMLGRGALDAVDRRRLRRRLRDEGLVEAAEGLGLRFDLRRRDRTHDPEK